LERPFATGFVADGSARNSARAAVRGNLSTRSLIFAMQLSSSSSA